jgi:hypothetical protein
VGSPIVISDDDEDAAFVDQQLQFREQRNTSSTSSQESQPTQRGDEQWKGSWERDLDSSSSRDGYVGGYSLDRVPVWNRHGTVDKQAGMPLAISACISIILRHDQTTLNVHPPARNVSVVNWFSRNRSLLLQKSRRRKRRNRCSLLRRDHKYSLPTPWLSMDHPFRHLRRRHSNGQERCSTVMKPP